MKNLRLRWTGIGWLLEVPVAVTAQQLSRVAQWAIPRQVARYRSLPPGDRKDELGRAIDLLKCGAIQQRLIDHDGDGVMTPFASTTRTTTKEYSIG